MKRTDFSRRARIVPMQTATLVFLVLIMMPECLLGCKCLVSFPVCQEVAASSVVFIGTVKSIDPPLLDPSRRGSAIVPAETIDPLQQDPSPVAVTRLKEVYLKMLGELPEQAKRELEAATTYKQVEEAFNAIMTQGRRARFRIWAVFHEQNDGDEGNDKNAGVKRDGDDDKKVLDRELAVWTGVDDCGINFQLGETYLVYAGEDEETGKLETSICSRTKRLSDAGPDLAYLHFFSTGGTMASRIEGSVTTAETKNPAGRLNGASIPVKGAFVGLTWSGGARYTPSGPDGRFVFDGLAGGRYELSVYDDLFPDKVTILAGPQRVDVAQRSCAAPVLVVEQKE
jgi:hypothetical protein